MMHCSTEMLGNGDECANLLIGTALFPRNAAFFSAIHIGSPLGNRMNTYSASINTEAVH